jgi:hypothetical protein
MSSSITLQPIISQKANALSGENLTGRARLQAPYLNPLINGAELVGGELLSALADSFLQA